MKQKQIAKAIPRAHGGAVQMRIVEKIELHLLAELSKEVTEDVAGALADFQGIDVALELKDDWTLADPFACILEGEHPELRTGRLWVFSVTVREEVRA